jgi:hypothetical protein
MEILNGGQSVKMISFSFFHKELAEIPGVAREKNKL